MIQSTHCHAVQPIFKCQYLDCLGNCISLRHRSARVWVSLGQPAAGVLLWCGPCLPVLQVVVGYQRRTRLDSGFHQPLQAAPGFAPRLGSVLLLLTPDWLSFNPRLSSAPSAQLQHTSSSTQVAWHLQHLQHLCHWHVLRNQGLFRFRRETLHQNQTPPNRINQK